MGTTNGSCKWYPINLCAAVLHIKHVYAECNDCSRSVLLNVQLCKSICAQVPAGGLGHHVGELAVSMDAVVFVVTWTWDGQATGHSVTRVFYFHTCPEKHTDKYVDAKSLADKGCLCSKQQRNGI